jgi:hypothetical protein
VADEFIRDLAIDIVRPARAVVDPFQRALDRRVVNGVEPGIQQIEEHIALPEI